MTELQQEKPEELISMPLTKVVELDVRPILRSGGEPFSAIMGAVEKTPSDGALKLRATFRPSPLFHVLAKQGWQHWVEVGETDDWIVWFYHATDSNKSEQPITKAEISVAHLHKDNPDLKARLTASGNQWQLDVRKLSPPEPMELTLSLLEKLPDGISLLQINERVPQFLLPLLSDRGYTYKLSQEEGTEEVRLEIYKEQSA